LSSLPVAPERPCQYDARPVKPPGESKPVGRRRDPAFEEALGNDLVEGVATGALDEQRIADPNSEISEGDHGPPGHGVFPEAKRLRRISPGEQERTRDRLAQEC
jgi:hypothetical protein